MNTAPGISNIEFIVDCKEQFLSANEVLLEAGGFKNQSEIIGRTCLDLNAPWGSSFPVFETNNNLVKFEKKILCFMELIPFHNNDNPHVVSFKAPVVSSRDEVMGVRGISVPVQSSFNALINNLVSAADKLQFSLTPRFIMSIVARINKLKQFGESSLKEKSFNYGTIRFNLREAQCLHYFLNNYSAEETAKALFISRKTVEFHIANIKSKLNCSKKSEITNKAIDHGFIDLMFIQH